MDQVKRISWESPNGKYKVLVRFFDGDVFPEVGFWVLKPNKKFGHIRHKNLPKYVLAKIEEMKVEIMALVEQDLVAEEVSVEQVDPVKSAQKVEVVSDKPISDFEILDNIAPALAAIARDRLRIALKRDYELVRSSLVLFDNKYCFYVFIQNGPIVLMDEYVYDCDLEMAKHISCIHTHGLGNPPNLLSEIIEPVDHVEPKQLVIRGKSGMRFESCEIDRYGQEETYESREQAQMILEQLENTFPFETFEIFEV